MKTELMPVPFYGDTLVLVNEEGTPFVTMKPIVENMGLDWKTQHRKLMEKFGGNRAHDEHGSTGNHHHNGDNSGVSHGHNDHNSKVSHGHNDHNSTVNRGHNDHGFGNHSRNENTSKSSVVIITTVGGDGKQYEMVCLPLRKLPAWLYSISPNKVAPQLRDKIVRYQEECDDALWDYWTKGQATRPGAPLPKEVNNAALQADKLAERLIQTTHPERRRILYAGIDRYCKMLGISTPALEALGEDAPPVPAQAQAFWSGYHQLTTVHLCDLNHARRRGTVAVQLVQVLDEAQRRGVPMPSRAELTHALRQSESPRFRGVRPVNSAITGKTVHCWVFAHGWMLEGQ